MIRLRRAAWRFATSGFALAIAAAGGLDGLSPKSLEATDNPSGEVPMIAGAKYGHTSLIAKDWRRLARFYQEQFGCLPVPPERDFRGRDLARGTGSQASNCAACTCGCRPWRGRADARDLQRQRPRAEA